MKRLFALVGFIATAPTIAGAQTQDLLDRGIKAYEAFQVEQARPLFLQVVSPSNTFQVSADQRVTAYKYLGASYAVLAIPDTAIRYFISALDFDPFTDLDPAKFSESELGPFAVAKNQIFRVGVRPIEAQVVDPALTETHYRFKFVTTHRANVTVTLVKQAADSTREVLWQGVNDGQREIRWGGVMSSGRIADSATYVLRVQAVGSNANDDRTRPEIQQQAFRVEQSFEPLEDTLPTLPPSMLLPAQYPGSAPWRDLVKGFAVGALAFGIPTALLTDKETLKGKWQLQAGIGVGVGLLSGTGSFLYRRHDPSIPENVTENARRQAQRARFNEGVRARNDAKLAKRTLVITPLAGAGR